MEAGRLAPRRLRPAIRVARDNNLQKSVVSRRSRWKAGLPAFGWLLVFPHVSARFATEQCLSAHTPPANRATAGAVDLGAVPS